MPQSSTPPDATRQAGLALLAVNFCMADIQAGIGPFLGVFLLAKGWARARSAQ